MYFYERTNLLLKSTKKKKAILEKEIGLTQGTIYNWENNKNKISTEALTKIADYFNVSTDYLLCRTNNPNFENNSNPYINQSVPQEIAMFWNKLNDNNKTAIRNLMVNLLTAQGEAINSGNCN